MAGLIATLVLVFAVDRGAKALVFRRGRSGGRAPSEPRFSAGFLAIQPVRNARPWSWPKGAPVVWMASFVLALTAAVALVSLAPEASALMAIGLGAALGGALGNLYDRLRHGAILDFLHVGIGGVFNPADVALVLGLAAVLASHVALATSLLVQA